MKKFNPAREAFFYLARFGFDMQLLEVDALSGAATNAGQIRDAIMAMPQQAGPSRVVLFGYSKGAADVFDAIVRYPEIQRRVAAVVSIAGAVASLHPGVRKAWLAENRLPPAIRFYSVVTLPERDRISTIVKPAYQQLARIDSRNDYPREALL